MLHPIKITCRRCRRPMVSLRDPWFWLPEHLQRLRGRYPVYRGICRNCGARLRIVHDLRFGRLTVTIKEQ